MFEAIKYLIGSTGTSGFGSKSTAEEVTAAAPDLTSMTVIITGATSGIGAETARVLAMRGARLVLPARSLKAAEETKARIVSEFPWAEIVVLPLDLSSHNSDGIEMTFATNYLGHFLLTKLLLNKMMETARDTGIQGRIVNVSSSIHSWFFGDGIQYLDLITRNKIPYDATRAYSLSKLANVLHTKELARRLKKMKANVTANCVHPGIVRTRLTRERESFADLVFFLVSKLVKTIPQAAATTCYVATHPRLKGISSKYFSDCNEASPSSAARNRNEALRLWMASDEMTAMKPNRPWNGPEYDKM